MSLTKLSKLTSNKMTFFFQIYFLLRFDQKNISNLEPGQTSNMSNHDFDLINAPFLHSEMPTSNLQPGNSTGNLTNAVSKSKLSAVNILRPENFLSGGTAASVMTRESLPGNSAVNNHLPGSPGTNLLPGNSE